MNIKYFYTRFQIAAYAIASVIMMHEFFIETVWYKMFAYAILGVICLMGSIMYIEDVVKENRKE